jgi:hypothetical protein
MIEITSLVLKRDEDAGRRMIASIKAGIDPEHMGFDEAEFVSTFNERFPEAYSEEEYQDICAVFSELAEAEVERILKLSNIEELETEVEHIRALGEHIGYSVSDFDEWRVRNRIEEIESLDHYYDSWDPSARTEAPASIGRLLSHEPTEDELIHNLFDTLKSG